MTGTQQVSDTVTIRTAAPGVMLVTLDDPPANALRPSLLSGLHEAIDVAKRAGDVKVMVLCSAREGFFAAGADIKHLSAIDAASFTAYGDQMRAINDRLAASPWLSIAAVDGLALGGGLELALACTLRVSGQRGRFGLPEVRIGLIPGAGGTQRLPRLIGRARALEIMVTGRQVLAPEALRIGLVDRLTDGDAVAAALELATELSSASLPAQLAVVRCVEAADLPYEHGAAIEVTQIQNLFEHGEAAEGIAAFVGKRPPRFA